MNTVLTVIGARPQFIKASALSRCIRNSFADQLREIYVHTGQHYDTAMSEVFFHELEIPEPKYNLGIGSLDHSAQTGRMMEGIETVLMDTRPDAVIVYGDTNSTLAGALSAVKIHIPVIHIEAGLRSYQKNQPEEINRIITDHSSTLLFSPTLTGVENLKKEGFQPENSPLYTIDNPGIFNSGDIMFDNCLFYSRLAESKSRIMNDNQLDPDNFVVATFHRDSNTDHPDRLACIFSAIMEIAEKWSIPIVLPLHPRTKRMMSSNLPSSVQLEISKCDMVKIIPPISYMDMLHLERNAKAILTDSGGVQKESYFFKKPCIILREVTEWKEIVDQGSAIIAGANKEKILEAYDELTLRKVRDGFPPLFGDGNAAFLICQKIIECLEAR